jgi:hypothetical protein
MTSMENIGENESHFDIIVGEDDSARVSTTSIENISTIPDDREIPLVVPKTFEVSQELVHWVIRYVGYSGCMLCGPGMAAMVVLFIYQSTGMQIAEMEQKALPAISLIVEQWPGVATPIIGIAMTNICIGILFVGLMPRPLHECPSVIHWTLGNKSMVVGANYAILLLTWGVVGTSIRENNMILSILHNLITVCLFITSSFVLFGLVLQLGICSHIIVRTALCTCVLAQITCMSVSLLGWREEVHGQYTDSRLYMDSAFSIGEYVYVASFSFLMCYIFRVAMVDENPSTGAISSSIVE